MERFASFSVIKAIVRQAVEKAKVPSQFVLELISAGSPA
jgi:hypothetical protein